VSTPDVVIRGYHRRPRYVHVIPASYRAHELLSDEDMDRAEWDALRRDIERRGWTWVEEEES
jgi:hypothetical protein